MTSHHVVSNALLALSIARTFSLKSEAGSDVVESVVSVLGLGVSFSVCVIVTSGDDLRKTDDVITSTLGDLDGDFLTDFVGDRFLSRDLERRLRSFDLDLFLLSLDRDLDLLLSFLLFFDFDLGDLDLERRFNLRDHDLDLERRRGDFDLERFRFDLDLDRDRRRRE